jgi:hypothetical protein
MKLMRYVPQANKKFFVKPAGISVLIHQKTVAVIHRYSHGHNTHA